MIKICLTCFLIAVFALAPCLGEQDFPPVSKENQEKLGKRIQQDPDAYCAELSKDLEPLGPQMMEQILAYGDFLAYRAIAVSKEDNILSFASLLLWRRAAEKVRGAVLVYYMDLDKGEVLRVELASVNDYPETDPDIVKILKSSKVADTNLSAHMVSRREVPDTVEVSPSPTPTPTPKEDSFYERNKEVIDRTAIGIGAAVITKLLTEWLSSASR